MNKCESQTKKVKGRGSKLTFLGNKTQNNVIDVIGNYITSELVKRIYDCKAWALIANTTPDVSHHEQLSICVRTVDRIGYCSEHLFCCKRAPGATAQQLYDTIVDAYHYKKHREMYAAMRSRLISL